mmetsp:Transcript_11855/g.30465  ORF Transcript_11855/g.30465 Transcript_11855/m.30465 type:complete len:274 (-) Transcript_11855:834-1655(-)
MVTIDTASPTLLVTTVGKEKALSAHVLVDHLVRPTPPQPRVKHLHDPSRGVGVRLVDVAIVLDAPRAGERIAPEREERLVRPSPVWHRLVVHRVPCRGIIDGVVESSVRSATVRGRQGGVVAVEGRRYRAGVGTARQRAHAPVGREPTAAALAGVLHLAEALARAVLRVSVGESGTDLAHPTDVQRVPLGRWRAPLVRRRSRGRRHWRWRRRHRRRRPRIGLARKVRIGWSGRVATGVRRLQPAHGVVFSLGPEGEEGAIRMSRTRRTARHCA